MTQQLDIDWRQILRSAGPYPVEAFNFVREGLTYTAQRVHGEPDALPDDDRHISGQQLCLGLRDFALDRYGAMALLVLGHWNIRRTDDFGRIVFAMIEAQLMSQTDRDSMEDFRAVYDFDEAFSRDALLECLAASG